MNCDSIGNYIFYNIYLRPVHTNHKFPPEKISTTKRAKKQNSGAQSRSVSSLKKNRRRPYLDFLCARCVECARRKKRHTEALVFALNTNEYQVYTYKLCILFLGNQTRPMERPHTANTRGESLCSKIVARIARARMFRESLENLQDGLVVGKKFCCTVSEKRN